MCPWGWGGGACACTGAGEKEGGFLATPCPSCILNPCLSPLIPVYFDEAGAVVRVFPSFPQY